MKTACLPARESARWLCIRHIALVQRETPFSGPARPGLYVEPAGLHHFNEATIFEVIKGTGCRLP